MTTLAQVIQERDAALADAASLRETLAGLTTDAFECPGETEHFTPLQRRILSALMKADGAVVLKDALYSALYFDRVNDPPEPKVIDIFISKIRGKLINHTITTHRCAGWSMEEIKRS